MSLCTAWAVEADLCGPCSDSYTLDSAILEDKLLAASETLYVLSGSQFPGVCEVAIRPCSSTASYSWQHRDYYSFSSYGITTWGSCSCRSYDTCSCPPLSELRLPHDNVSEVTEVKRDGAVVDDALYRLDPPNLLVSLGDPWPCCSDLSLPDTEVGTFSIEYTHGTPVPLLGVTAAADLACELYMACDPTAFEGECRLPNNVISIARQGVTVAKLVGELFTPNAKGPVRFGIPSIDLFLSTYAPWGAPSIIVSPDDPPVARIVGT